MGFLINSCILELPDVTGPWLVMEVYSTLPGKRVFGGRAPWKNDVVVASRRGPSFRFFPQPTTNRARNFVTRHLRASRRFWMQGNREKETTESGST